MIRRPPGRRRLDPFEPELGKIQRIHERIDDTNRIALVDVVIEAFGQQSRLPAICLRNEALHQSPRRITRGTIERHAFSHTQGHEHASGRYVSTAA